MTARKPNVSAAGSSIAPTQPGLVPKPGGVTYALIFKEGDSQREHELQAGATVAGRSETCELVLSDQSISRWHARFEVADGKCTVTDIGSRNGTFVNTQQIVNAQQLKDGDHVQLGMFPMSVRSLVSGGVVVTESADSANISGAIYRPAQAIGQVASSVDAGRLLSLLSSISRTLVGTQPIEEVLGHVVDLAFEATKAQRALLLMHDGGTLVPRVVRYREGTRESTTISRTMLDRVMRDRVSMLAMDAKVDPRLDMAHSIMAMNIKTFMCAPLWYESDIIGLLYVDSPTSRFTEADLDLFTAFSNYAAVAIAQARLAARVNEEVRQRERLQRYHSPAVVERILKGGAEGDLPFVAQERDLSVLFADIVGFTSIVEKMPPQQVVVLLNILFSRMADAIFQNSGTLDKFIGDAVLAVFGAPLDLENHALHAVRAAQDIQKATAAFREERPDPALHVRIAIHTGMAMAGDIGSPKRREYTVLGDVVNTAARIEETVAGPGQIVITRATFDRLQGKTPARSLGMRQLRGKGKEVEVFEVV
jgi:adenylate cyclase